MRKYLVFILSFFAISLHAQVTYKFQLSSNDSCFVLTDTTYHPPLQQSYALNTAYVSKNSASVYLFTNSNSIINRWNKGSNLKYLTPSDNVDSGFNKLNASIYTDPTGQGGSCASIDSCLGISSGGSPSKFLNEQGNFVTVSGSTSLPANQIGYGTGSGITSDDGFTREPDGTTTTSFNSADGSISYIKTGAGAVGDNDDGTNVVYLDPATGNFGTVSVSHNADGTNIENGVGNLNSGGMAGLDVSKSVSDSLYLANISVFDGTNTYGLQVFNRKGISMYGGTWNYKFPSSNGSSGTVMVNDGANTLSWQTIQTILAVLPTYMNDAAAITGGLVSGNFYVESLTQYIKKIP